MSENKDNIIPELSENIETATSEESKNTEVIKPVNDKKKSGKDRKISSMLASVARSSSSGSRGEVGMGLAGDVETNQRRRQPKDNLFLKGVLIYVCVALLLIGACVAIFWGYAGSWEKQRPEAFMDELVFYKSTEEWRDMLITYMPATYPAYENGEQLALEVFAPELKVGKITYIRLADCDSPQYVIFSDGRALAHVVLRDISSGLFGLGTWEVEKIFFYADYFDGVDFYETSVILPDGAILYVNGVEIGEAFDTEDVQYPAISPAEKESEVAPCKKYTFTDIYYPPTLTAELDGKILELAQLGESEYYFIYPDGVSRTLTVTAPVGVDVFVGGVKLTEKWAARSEIEGELGSLDDGGTGTKPMLSVWSISGIFGDPTVSARIGNNDVALLSSTDSAYIFDTPAECKYTVTVVLPVGAELYVNGKLVSDSLKVAGGATAEVLASGFTSIGRYDASELGVVPEAVPKFDMYIITGYLALPNISAKMNGDFIESAGMSVNAYEVRCDFDYSTSEGFDPARFEDAKKFTASYLEYICDGGAWENPENGENFKANYDALKAQMVEGTAGYVGIMESYRDVNKLPHYDSFTFESMEGADYVTYSSASASCAVEFILTRTRTVNGESVTDTLTGRMMVLSVLYEGKWQVWSFEYTENSN